MSFWRTVNKRLRRTEAADLGAPTAAVAEEEKSTSADVTRQENVVDEPRATKDDDVQDESIANASNKDKTEKQEHPTEVKADDAKDGATATETEDDSKYLTGTKLASLTFGLATATFVVALDNTIIATAIPRITTDFHALNDVGWYGSSYLLTTTSLQPSFGKIYTYFDVKWVYLSALMIFERASLAPCRTWSNCFFRFANPSCSRLNNLCNSYRLEYAHRRSSSRRCRGSCVVLRWHDDCRL